MVLDVDRDKRRISLGIKQTAGKPLGRSSSKHPAAASSKAKISNITEFGLFVGLPGDIDGMAHLSDLDWDRTGDEAIKDYERGQMVKAKVLDVDPEKERISLGIKQLQEDPFDAALQTGGEAIRRGATITGTVTKVTDGGLELQLDGDLTGFIRRSDLARQRSDQRPERFAVDERVDAMVMQIDRNNRKITMSIKASEIAEEKEAMAQFGSSDSGASLGDILGAQRSGTARP